jgi:cyclopropane fatty-acyl-phospholipid synthase-like methyltransferase
MLVESKDDAVFNLILQILQETPGNIQSLQKTLAAFRAQLEDFRAEQGEDFDELKRRLWELQFLRRERG